jgi:hypothetical protein
MALKDGYMEMQPFQCAIGGGTAEGRLELAAGSPGAALEMKAERIDIGAMLEVLGAKKSIEGILGAEIAVQAKGRSISTMMAGLNGRVVLTEREGRIYSRHMDVFGGSLTREVIRIINPFSEKEEYSELHCGLHVFHIKDGLATCMVSLADTKYTVMEGKGEVDLKEEKLDLLFALSPKKGIGISGLAEVGVSLPGAVRSFKLGGTLSDPSLTLNPAGAAETIGKMLGGFTLLGPLGLAAGLLDFKVGEEDACSEILEALENGRFSLEELEKELEKPAPASPSALSDQQRGP